MEIYLLLTEHCNLSCSHCIRKNRQSTDCSVSFSELETYVLPFLTKNFSSIHLIISGGEPTLSPCFRDIIFIANKLFRKVSICTNGTNLEKILELDEIKNEIEIQISLDGDESGFESMRGANLYSNVISSIEALYEQGFNVHVSTVVHRFNLDSVIRLASILNNFPRILWSISPEQAFNDLAVSRSLSYLEWNDFVNRILQRTTIRVLIRKLFDFELFRKFELKYDRKELQQKIVPNCGFGREKLYVYPDLTIYPCTCVDLSIGNLKFDSHEKIIENLHSMIIVPDKNSYCSKCQWAYICNGGCPGYSYYRTRKLNMGDSRCPLVMEAK